MLRHVPAEKAGGLAFWSRSPGESLVEVDNALHADGVGRGSDCLSMHFVSTLVELHSRTAPCSSSHHRLILVLPSF